MLVLIPGGRAVPRADAATNADDLHEDSGIDQVDFAVYRGASDADGSLVERWRRRESSCENVAALESKQAHWNDDLRAYTLDYDGRAQRPSIKNVQLIDYESSGAVRASGCGSQVPLGPRFQMGKLDDNLFTVDWTTPMSPMQAFGLALAICETPSQLSVSLSRRVDGLRGRSRAQTSSTSLSADID